MALKKKTIAPKNKGLKEKAIENTTISKSVGKEEPTPIKEGTPLNHTEIHNINPQVQTVGVNIGVTRNMGNFESLRVDCWLTDVVQDGETHDQALKRVSDVVKEELMNQVQELTED